MSHFSNKFVDLDSMRAVLNDVSIKTISANDKWKLEKPFSDLEIKEAIWGCEGSKSLGPDGYNFFFIRKCWSFMKKDFCRFFNDFHGCLILSKTVVSSFITLIPKKPNHILLDNYRPSCLVGCLYKAISKLLATRLKRVMDSVISISHNAFILGRQMLDGVLVANEVVDLASKENRGCLLFKVDFEKAYDKVCWDFLRFMLRRMEFGETWIKWIEALVYSSWMSVLVNGSPTKNFEVGGV